MTVHGVPDRNPEPGVTQLPARREPEPWLTRAELAQALHLHVTTIDRLVKEGMPSETWGLRSRRFLLSRVEAWLRERGRLAA